MTSKQEKKRALKFINYRRNYMTKQRSANKLKELRALGKQSRKSTTIDSTCEVENDARD